MKDLYHETYKEHRITISGRYIDDYFDWHEKQTKAVRLYYMVIDKKGHNIQFEDWQYTTVAKKKPFNILFWKIMPKITFEQQVEEELEDLIYFIKKQIDRKLHEQEVTEGLLDSLRSFK